MRLRFEQQPAGEGTGRTWDTRHGRILELLNAMRTNYGQVQPLLGRNIPAEIEEMQGKLGDKATSLERQLEGFEIPSSHPQANEAVELFRIGVEKITGQSNAVLARTFTQTVRDLQAQLESTQGQGTAEQVLRIEQDMKTALAAKDSEIQALKGHLASRSDLREAYDKATAAAEQQRMRYSGLHEQVSSERQDLHKRIAQLQGSLAQTEDRLELARQELKEHEDTARDRMEEDTSNLDELATIHEEQLAKLKHDYEEKVEQQRERLANSHDQDRERWREEIERLGEQLQEAIERAEADATDYQERIDLEEEERMRKEEECGGLRREIETRDGDISRLQAENRKVKLNLADAQGARSSAQQKLDQLGYLADALPAAQSESAQRLRTIKKFDRIMRRQRQQMVAQRTDADFREDVLNDEVAALQEDFGRLASLHGQELAGLDAQFGDHHAEVEALTRVYDAQLQFELDLEGDAGDTWSAACADRLDEVETLEAELQTKTDACSELSEQLDRVYREGRSDVATAMAQYNNAVFRVQTAERNAGVAERQRLWAEEAAQRAQRRATEAYSTAKSEVQKRIAKLEADLKAADDLNSLGDSMLQNLNKRYDERWEDIDALKQQLAKARQEIRTVKDPEIRRLKEECAKLEAKKGEYKQKYFNMHNFVSEKNVAAVEGKVADLVKRIENLPRPDQ